MLLTTDIYSFCFCCSPGCEGKHAVHPRGLGDGHGAPREARLPQAVRCRGGVPGGFPCSKQVSSVVDSPVVDSPVVDSPVVDSPVAAAAATVVVFVVAVAVAVAVAVVFYLIRDTPTYVRWEHLVVRDFGGRAG